MWGIDSLHPNLPAPQQCISHAPGPSVILMIEDQPWLVFLEEMMHNQRQ